MSGVTKSVIEKELYMTDFQRFDRDIATPHHLIDDSPWYLPYPGKLTFDMLLLTYLFVYIVLFALCTSIYYYFYYVVIGIILG